MEWVGDFSRFIINDLEMVDLTGIVPVRRAEGDADLPDVGQVQPDRA